MAILATSISYQCHTEDIANVANICRATEHTQQSVPSGERCSASRHGSNKAWWREGVSTRRMDKVATVVIFSSHTTTSIVAVIIIVHGQPMVTAHRLYHITTASLVGHQYAAGEVMSSRVITPLSRSCSTTVRRTRYYRVCLRLSYRR